MGLSHRDGSVTVDPGSTLTGDEAPLLAYAAGSGLRLPVTRGEGAFLTPLSYDCASRIGSNSNLFRSRKIRTLSRNERRAYALHSGNSVEAMAEFSCAFNARSTRKTCRERQLAAT